jgi:CubicO group peptidase (beta-lactamase class C family)
LSLWQEGRGRISISFAAFTHSKDSNMLRLSLLGAAIFLSAPSVYAQDARIDAAIAPYYAANEPGATVIVTRDGKEIFRKAYGLANLERQQPMRADMTLRIGSVTKQFTAVAVLMLAEEGKLKLDDEVTKYLPDYPVHGERITIEHLLTHTSGIPNYSGNRDFLAERHLPATPEQMTRYFKTEPLDFKPGSKWAYSNSGYILLGAIIEKASGQPYADFITKRILQPVGMNDTAYEGQEPRRFDYASGYSQQQGKLVAAAALHPSKTYAAGALVSTASDLARWDAAISQGKLLRADSWKRAFTPATLASGKSTNYGYGWESGKLQGLSMSAHGGNINGFSTYTMRVPSEKLFVAVLSNAEYGIVQPDVVATKAAAIAIGKPLPDFKPVTLEPGALAAFTGVYQTDPQAPRMIVAENGKLFMQRPGRGRTALLAHSANGFYIDKSLTHMEFGRGADGKVAQLVIHQDGLAHVFPRSGDLPAERKGIVLAASLLDSYVGKYQMAPGFVLEVKREGEQLVGQATGQPPLNLLAAAEGVFFVKQIGNAEVRFNKAADGQINGITWVQNGRERPAPRVQ